PSGHEKNRGPSSTLGFALSASERDVVVAEVVVGGRPEIVGGRAAIATATSSATVATALGTTSRRPTEVVAAVAAATATGRRPELVTARSPGAAREDDVRGEDFGAVALDPVLVLVARGAEAALHEDAGALVEVSRQGLAAL